MFRKNAEYSVHRLRELDAWAIPVRVLDHHEGEVVALEVNELELGIVYSVTWATFEKLRDTVDYHTWHGEQYYLKLRYWTRTFAAKRDPTPETPLQPALF